MSDREIPATIFVPISDIEIPANLRVSNKKKLDELTRSIEADGLLQPIGIRKGKNKPFSLVFGGHRMEAYRRLKKPEIEARLLDVDDAEAESATLAENLYRNPLKAADYLVALKRWNEIYTAEHPEAVDKVAKAAAGRKGQARKKAKAAAVRAEGMPSLGNPGLSSAEEALDPSFDSAAAEDMNVPSQAVQIEGLPSLSNPEPDATEEALTPRFDQAAAEVLNVSPQTVRADTKAAKVLNESELAVLSAQDVPITDIRKLAAIADEPTRKKAIALVASGMAVRAAIPLAQAPENATIEHVEAAISDIKPEAEMTDDEWVDHFCKDALARLAWQRTFRKDAITFRKTFGFLIELRNKTRKILTQGKTYRAGPFYYRMTSLLNVRHPNDWPVCGRCGGSGQDRNISQCGHCHGAGYSLKTC